MVEASHPTRVRELKPCIGCLDGNREASHPTRVRELKRDRRRRVPGR